MHVPITGAAAIPQNSFAAGVGVYADQVNKQGGIHGRKLKVVYEDDTFNPSVAVSKCKEMVEQQNAFVLVGTGSDQVDACARYAASAGVPYLSTGNHEVGKLGAMHELATYFAVSLSYEQQVPMVARLMATEYSGDPYALLVADNENLNNFYNVAHRTLEAKLGKAAVARRIPKKTEADAPAIATQICTANPRPKVVFWNASPSGLINVSKSMACDVHFVGVGLTNSLNIVAGTGCPDIAGSQFYSPMPGMDVNRRNAEFVNAYRAKNGRDPDDLGAVLFGLEKTIGQILQATGKSLTQQAFLGTVARVKSFNNGMFPPVYAASRFAGTAAHLLVADCNKREWVTKRLNEKP